MSFCHFTCSMPSSFILLILCISLAVALGCRLTTTLHITDQKPMFSLMESNISLNKLDCKVSASIYDWGTPPSEFRPDIILAADCVYFEPAFPLLQKTLKDLIGENTVCYFCFKKRRRADLQFMKVAKKMFEVNEVEDDPDKEVYSRKNIHLYRITAKT
ncbi:putative methyltransferase-domain-containing protein [Massariosphaeria phaeospora]|uniref:Putative methyltransferase-domain-containing protein n=1 Tax=Massariosphaeria phaeospora TaxID=100035 RepID=A0A7C8M921_9PLEO|nr:putative methyltransferase-domain-containing protein [Massariosphaeria phaeospora]